MKRSANISSVFYQGGNENTRQELLKKWDSDLRSSQERGSKKSLISLLQIENNAHNARSEEVSQINGFGMGTTNAIHD